MTSQSTGLNYLATILLNDNIREFIKINKKYLGSHELKVYGYISKFLQKYNKLPSLSLVCHKTELQPVVETDSFDYFKDEFINRAIHGRLIEDIMPRLNDHCVKGDDTGGAIDIFKSFAKECEDIALDNESGIRGMDELGQDVLDFISRARYQEGLTGVTSGWEYLDGQTKGFQKGGLYVIVARMKLGKSIVMSCMADAASEAGDNPLFVSMEMGDLQFARRYFAVKAGLDMNSMKEGRVSTFAENKIHDEIQKLKTKSPFYFVEGQFKKDVRDVTSLIQNLKPGIVYIDGAYLMKIASQGGKKWEQVTEIAENLKTTAMQEDIPIVVSFQLSREATKTKTVGFEHIHLSDAIGQLSEAVMNVSKVPPEEEDNIEERDDVRYINFIGGREGESGSFPISWDWKRMRFEQLSEDELF